MSTLGEVITALRGCVDRLPFAELADALDAAEEAHACIEQGGSARRLRQSARKRTMTDVNAWIQTLLLIVVFGLLAGVLRWAFGNDRRAVPDYTGDDFGLLNEVAVVPTEEAAKVLAKRLRTAGIKATAVRGAVPGAYRVMVFPVDVPDAKLVLRDV